MVKAFQHRNWCAIIVYSRKLLYFFSFFFLFIHSFIRSFFFGLCMCAIMAIQDDTERTIKLLIKTASFIEFICRFEFNCCMDQAQASEIVSPCRFAYSINDVFLCGGIYFCMMLLLWSACNSRKTKKKLRRRRWRQQQ